jgi:hypothetical protein
VVVVWFFTVIYAFWYFLMMDSRLFYASEKDQLVEFEKSALNNELQGYLSANGYFSQTQLEQNQGYIFHFYNAQCSCDKANQAHVKKLIKKYSQLGFVFLIVPKVQAEGGSSIGESEQPWNELLNEYPDNLHMLKQGELQPLPIPASPSTAVLNGKGELVYFGPYALGGVCKADDSGLIETVLNNMLAGIKPSHSFVGGFGCFCHWQ